MTRPASSRGMFIVLSGAVALHLSIGRLFYGKMRQRVAVTAEDRRSRYSIHEKEDLFSHLPVNVAEDGVDLYDGLSRYFDDVVEFEGKKARMEVSLVELPPLLQIQLQVVPNHICMAPCLLFVREFNLTVKHSNHTSPRHMSNLGRLFIWTAFLTALIPRRKRNPKLFKLS